MTFKIQLVTCSEDGKEEDVEEIVTEHLVHGRVVERLKI